MNLVNYISFPGLGIGEIRINKIAFEVGPFVVRWYGIIITAAIILGFILACVRAKKIGVSFDSMLDYAIFVILFSIVGARLYYVAFSGETYDSFYDVIAIWNGGLAIYGGLIGGFIATAIVSKVKKISLVKMLDVLAPCAMLGQAVGRFGNFANAEAYGYNPAKIAQYENNIFRMDIRAEGSDFVRHTLPTFLFESVWNIVGLIIILLVIDKIKKYDGQVILFYITWYGFGRAWIEMLRSDSLYLFDLRVSSLLGFLCFFAGVILMIIFGSKARRKALDSVPYESIYSDSAEIKNSAKNPNEADVEDSKNTGGENSNDT